MVYNVVCYVLKSPSLKKTMLPSIYLWGPTKTELHTKTQPILQTLQSDCPTKTKFSVAVYPSPILQRKGIIQV